MRTLHNVSIPLPLSDEESPTSSNSDQQESLTAEAEAHSHPSPEELSPASRLDDGFPPQTKGGITNIDDAGLSPQPWGRVTSVKDAGLTNNSGGVTNTADAQLLSRGVNNDEDPPDQLTTKAKTRDKKHR